MSKFYGIQSQPAIRQVVENIKDEVVIRKNNQFFISTVYPNREGTGAGAA